MKLDGATWNAVREAMGVKYSSGKFQKLMDDAGIDRPATRPSGRGKAKAAPKPVKKAPAKAKPKAKPAKTKPEPARSGVTDAAPSGGEAGG